jgi:hypothetical protein
VVKIGARSVEGDMSLSMIWRLLVGYGKPMHVGALDDIRHGIVLGSNM